MKKKLKQILLPLLLCSLPLSANAVNTTMVAHVGKMSIGNMWVISGEEDDTSTNFNAIVGRWNDHIDTMVLDYDINKISYCAGTKKECGNLYTPKPCSLIDHTQNKTSDTKIDIYLYPDDDFCQAIKESV